MAQITETPLTTNYKRDMVIKDTIDTCMEDGAYMRYIIKEYVNKFSDDEINKAYDDSFGDINSIDDII